MDKKCQHWLQMKQTHLELALLIGETTRSTQGVDGRSLGTEILENRKGRLIIPLLIGEVTRFIGISHCYYLTTVVRFFSVDRLEDAPGIHDLAFIYEEAEV